jgi:pimeloyl-[acyl-carrier protein] synthase
MTAGTLGVRAGFEPVNWSPGGLPTDPDEIMSWVIDPVRRGELYPLYHQLRRIAPVHRCAPEIFGGAWVLTKFADTDAMVRDPLAVNDTAVVDSAFSGGDGAFYNVMKNAMLFLDVPSHHRIRSLVSRTFTPRAIARWQPIAEQVANDLCDRVQTDGGMDLVTQFSYELPFRVISEILGIPAEDAPLIKEFAWDFARAGEKVVSPDMRVRGDDAARGLVAYFTDLVERRRSKPTDDLVSALTAVEQDGDRLSMTELVCNCILLMQAGHETTQDLVGNAMVALFRHPDQLAQLVARPELMLEATEEFLRYDGSVQINHRLLLADRTYGETTIPAGEMVYTFLGAANRDPAHFAEPDTLDISRLDNRHLAFSLGAYYCAGASLARTEASVGLRTLLARFPTIRPATSSFQWRDTLTLRGPQELSVTW